MDAVNPPLLAVQAALAPVDAPLDQLLTQLTHLPPPSPSAALADRLDADLRRAKSQVDQAVKAYHKAITKLGTAVDKALYHPPPLHAPPRFTTPAAQATLELALQDSLVRAGQRDALGALEAEAGLAVDEGMLGRVERMLAVKAALERGELEPAFAWVDEHRPALPDDCQLPFALVRSRYLSLLAGQGSSPAARAQEQALAYARAELVPFYAVHKGEVHRLLAALLFLPTSSSSSSSISPSALSAEDSAAPPSPYADLAGDWHLSLLPSLFAQTFWRAEARPEHDPLARALEVGANGAVARVEKALGVLAGGGVPPGPGAGAGVGGEAKELPIEIPLEPKDRHHAIFVCPVSKELATIDASPSPSPASDPTAVAATAAGAGANPAVLLACGHTVVRESLKRLNKGRVGQGGARGVKCAYCPVETPAGKELELHF